MRRIISNCASALIEQFAHSTPNGKQGFHESGMVIANLANVQDISGICSGFFCIYRVPFVQIVKKSPLALVQAGICVRDERSEVDRTEVAVHQESVDGLELEFAGFLGAELQREEDGSAVFEQEVVAAVDEGGQQFLGAVGV